MKFTDFNFKDYINQTLENIKFEKPTEVQEKLIPIVLSGRDLVGNLKLVQEKHTLFYSQFSKKLILILMKCKQSLRLLHVN
ncbi:DEAD-box ATP-dependent RNA helicase CshB [Lactococcus lactis]|nr:DEAD-box ATP-dependent RNA helicase CshB [Lactococcus lactis]